MPYIKKIEVSGFKTFSRKTTLLLDKGFTAITGPNGSGKTNIIDAVLFGLGELSARRLRASNFQSLIFHGSSNPDIKKRSAAKVVVQFDNSDGRLPTETITVTTSREIDQNGESVYRINGRRVSRAYLIEILSVAGISPYGHNVILQGALTRMAEISSQERRKIIEDMIGIAQYDDEKVDAEEKLKSANISIKTALGQVSEVQRRIEDLERERNDLLRYNFIRNEIGRLEALKLSYEVRRLKERIDESSSENKKLEESLENIRRKREDLRSKRHDIEAEWRKLGSIGVEENQTRIMQIQINIGELRSRLSELLTKISTGKSSLEGLINVKENTHEQIDSLEEEIKESQERIKQLIKQQDELIKETSEKQSEYDAIYNEATQERSSLAEKTKRIRGKEELLNQLHQEAIMLQSEYVKSQSRTNMYSERLKDLKEKRNDLFLSINRLEESLKELQDVQKDQIQQLSALQTALARRVKRKKMLEVETKEAGKIAETARDALVEFEARKDLVDKVKTEENSLKHVEELGILGVIEGIHGRLKNLIEIRKGFERAVEAAAVGWLNSLVTQDLNVAFICVETLKKLKLGRIKIIPLQGLSLRSQVNLPKINGATDKISAYIKTKGEYASAISFILGDTLLASDEKAALIASQAGYRSVTLGGDLYEAGGGVESGFYRNPLDFSSFVPSESAIKTLDKAVVALRENLSKREIDIGEIEREITETQEEITKLAESLGKLESEVDRAKRSISQTKLNIDRAEKNITNFNDILNDERAQVELYEKRRDELTKKESELQKELANFRKEIDPSVAQEREKTREVLGNEIIVLKKKVGEVETELSTLQSKIENVLKASLGNASIQQKKASSQISVIEKEMEESIKEKEEIIKKIDELEKTKKALSDSLLNIKDESKTYTSQIDDIDNQLKIFENEYEQADKLLDELRLNLQTFYFQMNRHAEQLKGVGYKEPLEVSSEQVQEAETSHRLMGYELEHIGAVNQLSQIQYEEQISRYKELSLRMNELEKEKIAIEDFIEEIEQKKYNAFMEAFNKINERIDKYFYKLTDGGNAALKLEDLEHPFAGGVDMVVQFVDKPPILVSGASSGERSVAAVAFLFALQEFTPASFYLLDEIDAHLDAFHVEKLSELLAEEAGKSQFVVVTLKPEMVSKADRIYGVYGREGISHVVSTSFKEAL